MVFPVLSLCLNHLESPKDADHIDIIQWAVQITSKISAHRTPRCPEGVAGIVSKPFLSVRVDSELGFYRLMSETHLSSNHLYCVIKYLAQ